MERDPKEMWNEISSGIEALAKVDGENWQAFVNLNKTALKPGALDVKTKTLVVAAIALACCSAHCIVGRVRGALEAGATRQELLEAAALARLMGGSLTVGPSVTLFLDSINTFAPDFGK